LLLIPKSDLALFCLQIQSNQRSPRGIPKGSATGLGGSSASGVYFAHVRVNGKQFRDSLETADRKTAGRKLRD